MALGDQGADTRDVELVDDVIDRESNGKPDRNPDFADGNEGIAGDHGSRTHVDPSS